MKGRVWLVLGWVVATVLAWSDATPTDAVAAVLMVAVALTAFVVENWRARAPVNLPDDASTVTTAGPSNLGPGDTVRITTAEDYESAQRHREGARR